jgi:DNA ligase-1
MELLRPMLACKTPTEEEFRKLNYPMILSPKVDGVRAINYRGFLRSRSMKLIPNEYVQGLFGECEGLDGELVVGNPWDKNLMQNTMNVMSYTDFADVHFYVFDDFHVKEGYGNRLINARKRVVAYEDPRIHILAHHIVTSYEEVLQWEAHYLELGYEGVMLRSLDGPYKQGRSTLREQYLIKVKRFTDSEAVVIGFKPLMRNHNEQFRDERGYAKRATVSANKTADAQLGAFIVRCLETGEEFNVGSGFTEAQRVQFWANRQQYIGHILKYKSFKVTGVLDKPRFPIFLGFRSPEDM